jgi:hypothetical protein
MDKSFKDGTIRVIPALNPAADMNNGGPVTRRIRTTYAEEIALLLQTASSAGNATMVMKAYAAATGGSGTAIPFKKQMVDVSGNPADAVSDEVDVADTGFTTTLSKNAVYILTVDPSDIPADLPFIQAELTEETDVAVVGSALWHLSKPRYAPMPSVVS